MEGGSGHWASSGRHRGGFPAAPWRASFREQSFGSSGPSAGSGQLPPSTAELSGPELARATEVASVSSDDDPPGPRDVRNFADAHSPSANGRIGLRLSDESGRSADSEEDEEEYEEDRQLPSLHSGLAQPPHYRDSASRDLCCQRLLLLGTVVALLGTAFSCMACVYLGAALLEIRRDLCHAEDGRLAEGAEARRPLHEAAVAGHLGHDTEGAKHRQTAAPRHDHPVVQPPRIHMPKMYGRVKEKTIWAYWTHSKDCPSSKRCKLPPAIQLCTETVQKNRGSFDYRIVHKDEVLQYVTQMELPVRFFQMLPAQQKDALMNAILARYGGVALDISSVLLRPLDEYWDEMVTKGATFWGYMYRVDGMPWENSEVLAVWLLMTRREGIFSSAVRSQIIGMGDLRHPPKAWDGGYHNPYFAMGDQTLTPVVSMFNYSLPTCIEDKKVKHKEGTHIMCPELESPRWNNTNPGPARNDAKLLLHEPRLGPQLPFAFAHDFSMPLWHVWSSKPVKVETLPNCTTMKDCWDSVFLPRYHGRASPGQPHVLNFVKLFNSGGPMKKMTRRQILADHGSFFYHWLRLAGLDGIS